MQLLWLRPPRHPECIDRSITLGAESMQMRSGEYVSHRQVPRWRHPASRASVTVDGSPIRVYVLRFGIGQCVFGLAGRRAEECSVKGCMVKHRLSTQNSVAHLSARDRAVRRTECVSKRPSCSSARGRHLSEDARTLVFFDTQATKSQPPGRFGKGPAQRYGQNMDTGRAKASRDRLQPSGFAHQTGVARILTATLDIVTMPGCEQGQSPQGALSRGDMHTYPHVHGIGSMCSCVVRCERE